MAYQFKAVPTLYNGIQYRSRLEAKWAAFFDLINWEYVYEPFDLNGWSPDFKLTTAAGQTFLVEVKPKELTNQNLRLKLGEASNYAKGILLIDDAPFNFLHIPNCIGITSVFGETKDYKNEKDFEFCSSVVMDIYSIGNGIYSLCVDEDEKLLNYDKATEFCLPIWKQAGNNVMFLKPSK